MADLDPSVVERIQQAVLGTKKEMKELYQLGQLYNKAVGGAANEATKYNRLLGSQRGLVTAIANQAKLYTDETGNLIPRTEKQIALVKVLKDVEDTINDIADHRNRAQADLILQQQMLKTGLTGVYAEQAKNLAILVETGEITESAYKMYVKQLQVQQKQTKHLEEQAELNREVAAATLEIREEAEKYTKGLGKALATARAIGNDRKVFGAFMLTQMVEHLGHINHQMHELVDTGMQAGEAIKIMREDFGVMSVLGLTKVNDVSKSLVANFGTANALTSEQRDAIGEMAYSYGLAGEEATNLMMAISRMPGESKDSAINFKQTADNIGKMKGVLPSQIMKEVAKNTQLMATFSKGGVEGFAMAAAEAKRLGVELSSVGSAAEKLLDFESSITSQMEASVLIGKELNFDRMREAALAGDLNGVMEEQARIMKEVGSMDSMNTLQKKALADAMGLTTEELEKMSEAQKFNNQYFGENSTALDSAIGNTLKYGGAVVGVIKEHGMMALTILQAITQLGTYIAIQGMSTAAAVQNTVAENVNTAGKQRGIIATIASKAATLAMNAVTLTRNIILGAGNLILAAGAGLMSLFGINTATAGAAGATASGGFLALGTSLGAFGAAAAPAIPIILAIGLALLAASPAIRVIGEVIKSLAQVIGNVLMKALEMLPSIVQSVANGFTQIISTLSMDNIGPLLLLGPAFLGMAAGLSALAIVGAATLPILLPLVGALTMLGVVAPALSGLGDTIGGLAGGGEGSLKAVEEKLDTLIGVIQKGGVINMDGQKVGEVVALALNTTGG